MSAPEVLPPPTADRTAHPFHMYDMIQEIPATLRETLRVAEEPARRVAGKMADRPRLYFTGCGTAFFAALLGEQFAAATTSLCVESFSVPALELSEYTRRLDASAGTVAVSHSGITKTTVEAVRRCREAGAFTVGITHYRDRPISAAAEESLIVGKGPDLSRCHTKCYVAGAVAAAQVALAWRTQAGRESASSLDSTADGLKGLSSMISRVLRASETICEELAESYLAPRSVYIAGTGPNVPTALETALKLKEASFLAAEGVETEQMLHGSWVALDRDSLVFVVAPQGRGRARSLDFLRALQALEVPTIAIATEGDREIPSLAPHVLEIPAVDELLSPFLTIVPLYLYAYYSSVTRGCNPDLLRYLDPTYWRARSFIFPPGTH